MPATEAPAEAAEDASTELPATGRRIGSVVAGSYRLTRLLGSGGSSHVFEAEHVRLGKPFAVKLLRTEHLSGQRAMQRFRREARAVARLRHEHVVSVVDCGELEDGTPYLVMELLDGEDLRSLLRREGPLSPVRAARIVLEACRGLAEAHAAGLIHRDLKPENLFVARRATGEDWCKVLDFGVAKMDSSLTTAQGAIVGTVRYMAPEQLTDGSAVTETTDVYALGAILYEALSGAAPHDGTSIQELMYKIINRDAPSLARVQPSLPPALVAAAASALARSQSQRPPSALALAKRLSDYLRDAPTASLTLADDDAPPPRPGAVPLVRTRLWHWLLAGSALGAGAAALYFLTHAATPAPTPRVVAPPPARQAEAVRPSRDVPQVVPTVAALQRAPRPLESPATLGRSAPEANGVAKASLQAPPAPHHARSSVQPHAVSSAQVAPPAALRGPGAGTTASSVGHFDPENPYAP